MKKFTVFILVIILSISIVAIDSRAQSCSDAGVCVLTGKSETLKKKNFAIGFSRGLDFAEYRVIVSKTTFQFSVNPSDFLSIYASVPVTQSAGTLGDISGLGDCTALISFKVQEDTANKFIVYIAGGLKLPTGADNITPNGVPFPLVYQPGLGTTDLLLYSKLIWHSWTFAPAIQVPFGESKNSYRPIEWVSTDYAKFEPSNKLRRKPDISLRVEKSFQLGDNNAFKLGLLPILKIEDEEYFNPDSEKYEQVENSGGMTFNIIAGYEYKIMEDLLIDFNIGFPVASREKAPDGLKRSFVFNASIVYEL